MAPQTTLPDVAHPLPTDDGARRATRQFLQDTLDSLTSHVAVLDRHGCIVSTNATWERFAGANGGRPTIGTSYLAACDAAGDDPVARQVATALRRLLDGRPAELSAEYPCHGGGEERWFVVSASRHRGPGPLHVVVQHDDITARRRAERERLDDALAWVPRLRAALAEERFVLHAQPIVDLATDETVQHELLIRLHGEDGALVSPGLFLPAAEQHGLIRDIDRWVIRQAAGLAGRGHAVELNLSAESLGDPGLFAVVERELRDASADPRLVVLELTETALLRCEATAEAFLQQAAALGCRLALDDFGTGYGGFTYLKRFPVHYLKIDVEFVRDLPRNEASRHVVRAVVNLARDFGRHTVAEGVEDAETLELLRDYGVDYAQGYFLGRPAPLAERLV